MGMPSRPHQFSAQRIRTTAEVKADHDAARGSARDRGYSARWDRASILFKVDRPICLGCEAIGRVTPTAVVDHVEPHKGDMIKFWDATLWQPACRPHHDVVKKALELRFARGELAIADLWLDSACAIRASLELLPTAEG